MIFKSIGDAGPPMTRWRLRPSYDDLKTTAQRILLSIEQACGREPGWRPCRGPGGVDVARLWRRE
jgi:hypothetical protein